MPAPMFKLVNLSGPEQLNLCNADLHNIIWGLKHAHAAAHGLDTEYERLRQRLADQFGRVLL